MADLLFSLNVQKPPDVVFGVVADLASYNRWLTGSETFAGVAAISPGSVGLGTTYTDRGPLSAMRGRVTEYAPPERVTFEQVLRVAPLQPMLAWSIRRESWRIMRALQRYLAA